MIGFLPRDSYSSISINPSVFPCLIKSFIYKGVERGERGEREGERRVEREGERRVEREGERGGEKERDRGGGEIKGGHPGGRKRKGKSKRMEGKKRRERGKRRGVQQISTILRNIIHSCANLFGSTEESGTTSQAKTHCAHDARLSSAWKRQDKSITL